MRLLLSCLLTWATLTQAQNAPPMVTITDATVDIGANTVLVTYDLADAEGDDCTVAFRASLDGGTTYAAEVVQVSGDVGPGIQPGTGHTITWDFGATPTIGEAVVMVVADDGQVPDIQAMVNAVDEARIAQRLQALSIPRHHVQHQEGLSAVRDTLINAYTAAGLELTLQDVTFSGATVPNVIGRHPGLELDTRTWIVDGHYDGVPNTPGADDNMTAVVATMEIAQILSSHRFRNSLRFIGFSFEELGLVGSGNYVQSGIPAWEDVAGTLNLEMIGYYSDEPNSQTVPAGFELLFPQAVADISAEDNRGNFLAVVGNAASQPLVDAYLQACDTYVPTLRRIPLVVPGNGQIAPDLRRSDHARFWDAGLQALMLTDGSEFRNTNYHTPGDTPATIDLPFLVNNIKATLAAAATLAQPINAGFDTRALGQAGVQQHAHAFPCLAEVFPNPVDDVLLLQLRDCAGERITARLFDIQGRRITGRDLLSRDRAARHELTLNGVPNGTYLLVLEAGESSHALKVEVKR